MTKTMKMMMIMRRTKKRKTMIMKLMKIVKN